MPCGLQAVASDGTLTQSAALSPQVKKNTKMHKVFNAYATRKGVNESALRFLLDGERIAKDTTPAELDLEDQDQIDCLLEQTGGR